MDRSPLQTVHQSSIACFCLLPKIHKRDLPGGPVFSVCTCSNPETIPSYLDSLQSLLAQSLSTYIQTPLMPSSILTNINSLVSTTSFLLWISSFYTSLSPTQKFLGSLTSVFCLIYVICINTLIHLAEFNNLSFNSSQCLQVKGVVMNNHLVPSYTCLFDGYMKQILVPNQLWHFSLTLYLIH